MEKYNTGYILHRLATINLKDSLAEIMLGFFGGVLFFISLVYSIYLFNSVGAHQNISEHSVLIKE